MAFGQLTEVGRKKNNTGNRYKIDGNWYYPSRTCNTDGIQAGMQVEFESSFGGNDGKLRILNRVRPGGVPSQQHSTPNGHGAPGHLPQVQVAVLSPLDDSGMRFVSNLVGSAIMAGKVE